MSDLIIESAPLQDGAWPTVDPFLFCAYHRDDYPRGNGALGPAEPLTGRDLGMDFSRKDGWSMYHGKTIPGFPQHPHRGFETVTIARRGLVDHADSLGATARYGNGDVQWLTAGSGIVHSEMFPLLESGAPNPLDLFQIWLNLPAADKMVDPYFSMQWATTMPVIDSGGVLVTVVAGPFGDLVPPPPPPSSWASRPDTDIAIWTIQLGSQAECDLPAANTGKIVRTLYVVEGTVAIGGTMMRAPMAASIKPNEPVTIHNVGGTNADVLVLQGKPISEPVMHYGPFVMNDRAGIEQAFQDYQRTGFGGWRWKSDDPVNGLSPQRFARRPDGRIEQAP
ncbi:MAG: pirin family protein [Acidimicrobiia bacterium]